MNASRWPWLLEPSHDLILRQASGLFAFHGISSVRALVLDVSQPKRSSSVLVAGEFGYCSVSLLSISFLGQRRTYGSLSILSSVKLHDPSSTGATIWFILDFGAFDFANGGEKLNKILVASRPWKLCESVLPQQTSPEG